MRSQVRGAGARTGCQRAWTRSRLLRAGPSLSLPQRQPPPRRTQDARPTAAGAGRGALTCTAEIWTGGALLGAAGRGAMAVWGWACAWACACIWARACWGIINNCPFSLRTRTIPGGQRTPGVRTAPHPRTREAPALRRKRGKRSCWTPDTPAPQTAHGTGTGTWLLPGFKERSASPSQARQHSSRRPPCLPATPLDEDPRTHAVAHTTAALGLEPQTPALPGASPPPRSPVHTAGRDLRASCPRGHTQELPPRRPAQPRAKLPSRNSAFSFPARIPPMSSCEDICRGHCSPLGAEAPLCSQLPRDTPRRRQGEPLKRTVLELGHWRANPPIGLALILASKPGHQSQHGLTSGGGRPASWFTFHNGVGDGATLLPPGRPRRPPGTHATPMATPMPYPHEPGPCPPHRRTSEGYARERKSQAGTSVSRHVPDLCRTLRPL